MIRGVIFDLGGTLITPGSYEQANAGSLMDWIRARGFRLDDRFAPDLVADRAASFARRAQSEEHREIHVTDVLRPIFQRFGLPAEQGFVEDAERVFYAPEVAAGRPLVGAHEVLRWLRTLGLRAGIASNATSHYVVTELCRAAGLAPFLDPVVSSAGVGWAKPDRRIFDTILSQWSVTPAEAIMVGDTLAADILGGKRIGMRTILLTATRDPEQATATPEIEPDAIAPDLMTVKRIIEVWLEPDRNRPVDLADPPLPHSPG
jgi:putative hydrolase of the HAD superfamily